MEKMTRIKAVNAVPEFAVILQVGAGVFGFATSEGVIDALQHIEVPWVYSALRTITGDDHSPITLVQVSGGDGKCPIIDSLGIKDLGLKVYREVMDAEARFLDDTQV